MESVEGISGRKLATLRRSEENEGRRKTMQKAASKKLPLRKRGGKKSRKILGKW